MHLRIATCGAVLALSCILSGFALGQEMAVRGKFINEERFEELAKKLPANGFAKQFIDRNENVDATFVQAILMSKGTAVRLPGEIVNERKAVLTSLAEKLENIAIDDEVKSVEKLLAEIESATGQITSAILANEDSVEVEREDDAKAIENAVVIVGVLLARRLQAENADKSDAQRVSLAKKAILEIVVEGINREINRPRRLDPEKVGKRSRGGGSFTSRGGSGGSYANYAQIVENLRRYELRLNSDTRAYKAARRAVKNVDFD